VHHVFILSADASTLPLLRSVATALKWELTASASWSDTHKRLAARGSSAASYSLVVLDLQALATAKISPAVAIAEVRGRVSDTRIVLIASRSHHLDAIDQAWARMHGADALISRINAVRWEHSGGVIHGLLTTDTAVLANEKKRALPYIRAAQRVERGEESAQNIAAAEASGVDPVALAVRMGRSGGVAIQNRAYRLHTYDECFVASEGVDWITRALSVPRDIAIAIARALQSMGLIYHVVREQPFDDGFLFFRVARTPASFVLNDFLAQAKGPKGFDRRDRSYMNVAYANCFVGSEAVAWIRAQGFTLNEAMTIGQRLVNLSIVSHVVDEHPFQDGNYFYRFNESLN
jgi:hypothetical protein